MKKNTNRYRRCANCPHQQSKCCCQRNPSSNSQRLRPITSRNKREPSTIDNSSAINTTIPTIIAQFSALRTENHHLKRQLLNVSTFLKDENCPPNQPDSSLSEKLFISNKTLKEALLEIDNLSRANKELYEMNSKLNEQCEGMKIQVREVESYLQKYKKRCKRIEKVQEEQLSSKQQMEKVVGQNSQLQEQNQQLRQQIRCLRFENHNYNMVGALSPEWVAHTGNKYRQDHPTREEETSKEDIELWKRSLSETIGLLRNEGTLLHSQSVSPSSAHNGIHKLLTQLLQSYSESILTHFQLLMKEFNRKLNNYQKKMNNLASKLQNLLMGFRNKKLKKKLQPPHTLLKTQRLPAPELTNRML